MKKTLLLFAIVILASGLNAQTVKVWNFGGDPTVAATSPAFPLSTGIGIGDGTAGNPAYPVMIDGLGITGIATNLNMAAVNASVKPFTDANAKAYAFVNRLQTNGAGYASAAATDVTPLVNLPIQRYFTIDVSGNSTIYVIGVTGSNSSERKLFVTDGTNLVGTVNFPVGNGALVDGTVNYTGPAAKLYLFGNASLNLTLLSATNLAKTSLKSLLSDKGIAFTGKDITNSNGLDIEVFNVLGKSIAKANTSISTSNFQKGIYIVRITGTNEVLKFSK